MTAISGTSASRLVKLSAPADSKLRSSRNCCQRCLEKACSQARSVRAASGVRGSGARDFDGPDDGEAVDFDECACKPFSEPFMTVTIFHNPRCSKSRQTLALIEERGLEPDIIAYLSQPPATKELKRIIAALGVSAHDLIRTSEADYVELGLSDAMDEDALIAAMASHPRLIQRPIVLVGDQARIGRPPERVLEILP